MSKQHQVRLSLLTIILAFILVGSIGIAAVTKTKVGSVEPTMYYYNGPSSGYMTAVLVPGNWGTTQLAGFTCEEETQIPCSLLVPDDTELKDYLQSLGTLKAIQEASGNKRNK